MTTIPQYLSKLIKNLAFLLTLFAIIAWGKEAFFIKNAQGQKIELKLALTKEEHTKGLSGLKNKDFNNSMAMLFVNSEMAPRKFWMPNTYFDLDIIFLDDKLKVVGMDKKAPHHPGLTEPPAIYKTSIYLAQFILETKAGSPFSKSIKIGDQLNFTGPISLSEIVLKTHQKQ